MEDKPLFESKHCLSLKCVLFLFYGGLGCIYPFLQSNMAHKGFAYTEIYSISVIIPIAALFGPLIFALLADKWATSSAFAYGKRIRILTAISIIASIVLYVVLMFVVSRTSPPEICAPQVSFLCNRKGAFVLQEKCSENGVCHDWKEPKHGDLILKNCTYSCQRDAQFESNCYERHEHTARMAALKDQDDGDEGDVVDESDSGSGAGPIGRDTDGDGIPDSQDADDDNDGIPDAEDDDDDNDGIPDSKDPDSSNDLDGDGIPNELDPDDDNDGILDEQDDDDDNDGIPDDKDLDDDNDGIPDTLEGTTLTDDLDGDGIPNDVDDDDDNDGIPDTKDDDDDNDGIPDSEDLDDDNDGVPDALEKQANSNDLDGDGIPNDQDPDDDNDGIPDSEDDDDDNDGIPDAKDTDDDNDGIPDTLETSTPNDLDGDGIPNEEDTDDDNDGIPDTEDTDDDNDGIPDAEDTDDDNDGIPDTLEDKPRTDDLDGDGIPNDEDTDDDNDGIPDSEDDDDDNDGIPDSLDKDDDNDGIPDIKDQGSRNANDLDGDGIPNEEDTDDDNDGIPDDKDDDDDNDGIADAEDDDDDNDGVPDNQETVVVSYAAPQICVDATADDSDSEDEVCHKYNGEEILVKGSFNEHNEKDDVEECIYPLDGFRCPLDKAWMKTQAAGCKPVVECEIGNPYEGADSLLHGTTCDGDEDNDGDDDEGDSTYYYYLSLRSLLDFFLLGALTLLNTIIIVITRDPASTGVADFGRQLVWGAIGWIVFFNDDFEQPYMLFIILFTTAAVILLSPLKMDLSPQEEWWKFKTVPQKFLSMPALKKYLSKCWLPFLVTIALGALWSTIDSIDESHMVDIPKDDDTDDDGSRKVTVFRTVFRTLLLAGDLLAIPVLVYSKRIIEIFGTCKILVAAFLSLVIRYILLAIFDFQLWDIIEDWLLPTTLGLTWVTLVLHFRSLLPRKATALAQSLPVIAHFGFGRFFGALIGIERDYDHLENDYEIIAGVLFAVTILSIVLYRYRDIVLNYLGNYIPALKPGASNDIKKTKGETNV